MTIAQAQAPGLEELLRGCAAGDHASFRLLYRATWNLVFNVVRRQLFDESQSEEVAQDVFLEVWQTAARYEAGRGSVTTWLTTMARRRAIDRVRSSQASRDREDRMFRREHRVAFDEVLEAVEARFERDRLTAAMGVLTPLQREAITATYLQGRTVVQATALLGASESALKTRVRDGVLGLRAVL